MSKQKQRVSLVLALLLCFSVALSACDMLKKSGGNNEQEPLNLPPMQATAGDVELTKDAQGLTEVDHQYLSYAKEKWAKFKSAFDNFGAQMNTYVDRIFNDALLVDDSAEYVNSRNELLSACHAIEAVNPLHVPAGFKNLYDQMDYACNQCRGLISRIKQTNGTNLPAGYDEIKPVVDGLDGQVKSFFDTVAASGIDAAQSVIPALDWAKISAVRPDNRKTFNVSDLGIKWGADRFTVMGVEGLQENAFNSDTLTYPCEVYQYKGTRTYHFNEQGQLDSYYYEMDPASYDPNKTGDPVYDDVFELSSIVMYFFILDKPAQPITPVNDGTGKLVVTFDPPAESVVLSGVSGDPAAPIRLDVTAKTAQ